MHEIVLKQFHATADSMNLDPNIRKILAITNNEIMVHFPVKMDNGSVEIFSGYRVQHNNALGPYKGGLRYHPTIDVDDARAPQLVAAARGVHVGDRIGRVIDELADGVTPGAGAEERQHDERAFGDAPAAERLPEILVVLLDPCFGGDVKKP